MPDDLRELPMPMPCGASPALPAPARVSTDIAHLSAEHEIEACQTPPPGRADPRSALRPGSPGTTEATR